MKRIYLMVLALVASFGMTMGAQTLIDEGFEDVPGTETTTTLPPGWERVDSYSGTNDLYRWAVHYSSTGSTMSGHDVARPQQHQRAGSSPGNLDDARC